MDPVQETVPDPVVLTRAYKRGPCWVVEGRVRRQGEWLKSSFVVHAPDVEHMTRADFEAFALRNLLDTTEDHRWDQDRTA